MKQNNDKIDIWQEDMIERYKWRMIYPRIYRAFHLIIYLKNLIMNINVNKLFILSYYTSYHSK
jgi:hypothetical protein